MIECDVLVVGGGPAGLSTAESASKNGLEVICVEKKETVGKPVRCAEGISKYFLKKLPFTPPKKLLEWNVDGLVFVVDQKKIVKTGEEFAGYSISRDIFEPWLALRAEKAGVRILTGAEFLRVKDSKNCVSFVKKNDEMIKIKSRYLIGADGVVSKVAESIGMKEKPDYSPGYVYSWEVKGLELDHPEFEYLFLGEFSPNGYGYIFPKSKNRANIGVGDLFGKKGIKEKFKKFVNNKEVKEYLGDNLRYVIEKSKEAPFETRHAIGRDNVFFVGDSANQNVKPFIEGFLPAIICGHALGKNLEGLDVASYKALIDETLPEISQSEFLIEPMIKLFKRKDNGRFNELLDLMIGN